MQKDFQNRSNYLAKEIPFGMSYQRFELLDRDQYKYQRNYASQN
jgi:hypothetical protein